MQYDRQIEISVGMSRMDTNWRRQLITLSELYAQLKAVKRSPETFDEYNRMTKQQQGTLKDVGGFVAGQLNSGHRKADAVTGRDIITLDMDSIKPYGAGEVLATLAEMKCGYCVYSTRSHCPSRPRLRVLLPLDRTVSPDEYEAIARKLAQRIGIEMCDPSTFEPSRLMYWSSCCSDGEFICESADAPLTCADDVLAQYNNWHDYQEWPQVPGHSVDYHKLAVKQGDPCAKAGIVGAFNRVFDIPAAMDEFLPGIYTECGTNRYTYTGGSSVGGAVLYDDGKFLYSHHATDPCSGRLVNAFDLVRLHKFGERDEDAAQNTPVVKLPSYVAMSELASSNRAVSGLLIREQRERAKADLVDVSDSADAGESDNNGDDDDDSWEHLLDADKHTGHAKPTINNILIILEHDAAIRGGFANNRFDGFTEVLRPLPWNSEWCNADGKRRVWSDTDVDGLYWYMEKTYFMTKTKSIDSAVSIYTERHSFNELQSYLDGLTWDGAHRLDTVFIDYLGAADNEYSRTVTRKMLTAAVARAMQPGCKFDNMLIFIGKQGRNKSMIINKLSKGWLNDSIRTFEGKEAAEQIKGVWLVEIAELDAFRRSDVSRVKQFLSLQSDRYRAAYGRNVQDVPRSCVFFGTCNNTQFLTDMTGNRRFWPMNIDKIPRKKSVKDDLTDYEIDQIWAEAKLRWQLGEPLYLDDDIQRIAEEEQEAHLELSPKTDMVLDFLDKPIPDNWSEWDLNRRRDFWAGAVQGGQDIHLVQRRYVTATEIWQELFNGSVRDMKRADTREINDIIRHTGEWESQTVRPYSKQKPYRGFARKMDVDMDS